MHVAVLTCSCNATGAVPLPLPLHCNFTAQNAALNVHPPPLPWDAAPKHAEDRQPPPISGIVPPPPPPVRRRRRRRASPPHRGGGGRDAACPQCFRTASAALHCDALTSAGNALQVIDLNTFTADELQQAMQAGLKYDGVWMIPENSPQVRVQG